MKWFVHLFLRHAPARIDLRTVRCRAFMCLPEQRPHHYDDRGRHFPIEGK